MSGLGDPCGTTIPVEGGNTLYIQGSEPASPVTGDLWFDKTNTTLFYWDGAMWQTVTAAGSGGSISIKGSGTWDDILAVDDLVSGDMYILTAADPDAPERSDTSPAEAGDGITWDGTAWMKVGPIRGPACPQGERLHIVFL